MFRLAIVLAVLLAFKPAEGEWRVGEPAPLDAAGQVTVALGTTEIPAPLRAGVEELRPQGVPVVSVVGPSGKAVLVDEKGVVRRVAEIPDNSRELIEFVTEWQTGRVLYGNRCARCHGEDGMDTGYPYIAQLGGIGRRRTSAEIREKLNPAAEKAHTILVRGEHFSRLEFEALVTYISGL